MHVVAGSPHLRSQQTRKLLALCCRVVVAVLLVREQRVYRFLSNVSIKVIPLQVCQRSINYALSFRSVKFPATVFLLGRRNGRVLSRWLRGHPSGWRKSRAPEVAAPRAIGCSIASGVEDQTRCRRQNRQRKNSAEKQSAGTRRAIFQHIEARCAVQSLLGHSANQRVSSTAVFAWNRNCKIGEQVQPQSHSSEKSCFIAHAVAEQLQRFVAVFLAKMERVQTQEPSVYLLRHTPPSISSWPAPHATNRQVCRHPSAQVSVQPRSNGNTGAAPAQFSPSRAGLTPQ